MIYGYEISTPTDRFFWSYWSIFCTFTPLTAWKKKLSKTWKKHLKISFYTSVPKIMITGYTVPGIWHMTDVTVTFWFWAIFCLFTPLTAQKIKMKDMKKKTKKLWRYHHFTQVYQKIWSYAILFLRYGMWWM